MTQELIDSIIAPNGIVLHAIELNGVLAIVEQRGDERWASLNSARQKMYKGNK